MGGEHQPSYTPRPAKLDLPHSDIRMGERDFGL
jgi:hypothetical protein